MATDGVFHCLVCDEEVDSRRIALGYLTCLFCGQGEAKLETARKERMTVSQGHKQGLTFVSNPQRQLKWGVNKVARDFMS